jgi:hypothetical protein
MLLVFIKWCEELIYIMKLQDFHPITFSYADQAQPKNPFLNQFQYQSLIVTTAQHFVLQTENNVEIV